MSLARWQDLCLDATDPERRRVLGAVLGLRRDPAIEAVTLVGRPAQRVWVNLVDLPSGRRTACTSTCTPSRRRRCSAPRRPRLTRSGR